MNFYKKLLLLPLLTISLYANYWDDYNLFAKYMGYERDYNKAITIAKKEKKDLLVILVSDGCPFCHRLVDTILTKKEIREYINKKYIKLIINKDTDKNYPKKLVRPFEPVTYIIDAPSGQIIDEIDGWQEEESYLWHL
ncbi:thioredoxin fold domain-containing protein [Sulfurimonas marina]|uniref:Thioredoxin family protein n=1 Tax=Sulfurimonas marina TaxID=2590551 RepID=A0A7M1AUU8_9BACT|nr:thioredoxin family protein [Sulfurimonas marina]QOP41190.1 thioredoxin family protein [Sulfurimonas marina]